MEKLSNRESILLGYSPQRNISNNLPTSSPDSPDIDFHDVFGGPPRRASIQETRCSFGENDTDSYALTTSSHRHRWSGLSERPVFGEDSATRRRYTSHDFFDDIFRVNESLSTSPRKNETDSFSSNPGSKVLSPVRPLPPRAAEPFPSASLPAQFSLPAKLIKGTDLPTFGSSARNHHKNKDGADEITIKNELKESKVKSTKRSAAVFNVSEKVKKQVEARTILNGSEMDKANLQGSPKESNGGLTKNRGRQKVKEFVKIFNQEASGKPTFNSDSQSPQSQSSRWKERGKFKPEEDPSVAPTKLDDKVHLPNGNKNHKPHASIRVNEFLKQFEKQHSETRSHNHEPTDISSGLKDKSASTAASIPDGSKAVLEDPDDSFQGNILIKELPQDENELPQAGDNQEVFQDIDTKIRKWSDGKEGNIRSLLSTLQYVLWPESGWKPVPLVDIIEGNAVKRSYQKALLTLHPDKLQQKGATSHQKYIAEKVFDVLQEAWTHFTSVGSM
ncbi:J domain-containing protein required for chloroplast accumulation response 1 isoform X2 [Ricinus communis]|uniref:J domain-containing protein required for chloroplast accumulation response 1 isoform X2 n=1 Tax=Ricinus communis TaxID=3988 RepID=UPI00201A45AD|nr:J domain-containing protein required for chloroplast accumulation response 1 isoform X2 [Ricinus communis]